MDRELSHISTSMRLLPRAREAAPRAAVDIRGARPESIREGVDQLFMSVVVSSAPLMGPSYFDTVPRILAEAWDSAAFMTHISASDGSESCRLIGAAGFDAEPGSEWLLRGQPWYGEDTTAAVYHRSRIAALYPDDPLLAGAQVYLAVPLTDSHGRRIGYIGLIDDRQWTAADATAAESLLRLVAPRASAELERHTLHERLLVQLRNFRALADETGEGFLTWTGSEHPRIISANDAVSRLTGYTEVELRANPEPVIAPIVSALRAFGVNERSGPATIMFPRRDGNSVLLEATVSADDSRPDEPMYRCVLREPASEVRGSMRHDAWLGDVLRELPFAAIVIAGTCDEVLFMNRRACEVTGGTQNDILERIVVSNDARGEVSMSLREFSHRALPSRTSHAMVKLKLPRGRERVIQMRTQRITHGGAPALILAPLDVTQQTAHQNELQERADVQGRILSSLPADIVAIDAAGRVIALSTTPAMPAGRSWIDSPDHALRVGDDFLGMWRDHRYTAPDVGGRALRGVGAVLSKSAREFAIQYEVADDEGAAHWLLLSAMPLEGEGALVVHGDITALKKEELDLAAREAGERELLQHLPDQLARISAEGHVREVVMPGAASRMVAPLPRAPMGRSVKELLAGEAGERLLKAIGDAIRANAITSLIISLPYGHEDREYEMRIVPTPDQDSLVYVRDRTADQWTGAQAEAERGDRQRIVRENAYGLTFREVAVLELMAQGASDKEIASTLGVSVFTVYKHVSKILHKMNAASRTEASLRTVREHMFG